MIDFIVRALTSLHVTPLKISTQPEIICTYHFYALSDVKPSRITETKYFLRDALDHLICFNSLHRIAIMGCLLVPVCFGLVSIVGDVFLLIFSLLGSHGVWNKLLLFSLPLQMCISGLFALVLLWTWEDSIFFFSALIGLSYLLPIVKMWRHAEPRGTTNT